LRVRTDTIEYDGFEYGRRSGTPHFDTAMGGAHTCEMKICDFTAAAMTTAPLPPRCLRRAQATTLARLV
jgi:hypothetical protein